MSRYLSTQHWRSHNASDALLEVREQLRGQIEPTNKQAPWLYSQHLLAADDDYGSLAGLVVQGDELKWSDVDAVFDFALFGHAEHLRRCHPDLTGTQDCAACKRAEPLGQIWLASVIQDRRGKDLGELRRAASEELGPDPVPPSPA